MLNKIKKFLKEEFTGENLTKNLLQIAGYTFAACVSVYLAIAFLCFNIYWHIETYHQRTSDYKSCSRLVQMTAEHIFECLKKMEDARHQIGFKVMYPTGVVSVPNKNDKQGELDLKTTEKQK